MVRFRNTARSTVITFRACITLLLGALDMTMVLCLIAVLRRSALNSKIYQSGMSLSVNHVVSEQNVWVILPGLGDMTSA